MAAGGIRNAKALNAIMRVTAEMLADAKADLELLSSQDTEEPPLAESVDCEALGALIDAAQAIHLKYCPGV